MTHTLEHSPNHSATTAPEVSPEEVTDPEILEADRLRIIGQAILGRTISLVPSNASVEEQAFTPVEKIPRTPESFAQ